MPEGKSGPKRGFWAAAAGLLSALIGCGDATVIHSVSTTVAFDEARFRRMASGAGVPTMVYGALWPGVSAEELVAQLRAPNRMPASVRFTLIEGGADADRYGDKLILVFNPSGAMRAERLCEGAAPTGLGAATDGPFSVFIAFCSGQGWMASAMLDAPQQRPGDWPQFQNAMRQAFMQILKDAKAQDR